MQGSSRSAPRGVLSRGQLCLGLLILLLIANITYLHRLYENGSDACTTMMESFSTISGIEIEALGNAPLVGQALGSDDSGAFNVSSRPLPMCTNEQMSAISQQLPSDNCERNQKKPWNNDCSFSYATRCPEPIWLHEYHSNTDLGEEQPFISFFVGCNKAIDAVNALRMGSRNPRHDVTKWTEALAKAGEDNFDGSSCGQFEKDQVEVQGNQTMRSAQVFCFEPVPATFRELSRVKLELQWANELVLEQAALSSDKGVMRVSDAVQLGSERAGINNFEKQCRHTGGCKEIPIYTLDDYVGSLPHASDPIHYLSIDVEGYDFEVLKGGSSILSSRVHYVEFEYNWKGPWGKQSLKDVIDFFDDRGFACYWPGFGGYVWRITGCWQDHYNFNFWSNVACVNLNIPEVQSMADRMEELFHKTIAMGSIDLESKWKVQDT